MKRWPTTKATLLRSSFPAEHCVLNLVCEDSKMTGEPVEQLALNFIGRTVSDQGTLGGVPAQLFQLCQIVLHGLRRGLQSWRGNPLVDVKRGLCLPSPS